MDDFLKNSLNWFKTQTRPGRISLIAGLIMILALSIFLCVWLSSTSYSVLFNNLDSRDANQIIHQLEQSHINYQVRNQGSDILIDKNLIDKTRIKLMGSGVQFAASVGFELFDKSDFGMTDFSQKINYQRALQGELERTITSLEEVKQARVHLVIPENHLFQQEDNQPRAAISLQLSHSLSPQQVRSIQQLIAASVAHLPLDKVVIVDQSGNSLTTVDEDAGTNHFTLKKSVERYLSDKVTQMLHRVFAEEEVMVKIDATLNYDELERERIKPQSDGVVTHEKETEHSTSTKLEKTQTNRDLIREKSYQLGSEKERFIRASGNIERLTISVVVPQHTEQQTLIKIERLVKSVVGFDLQRGDSISVEALIAVQQPSVLPAIPVMKQKPLFPFLKDLGIALTAVLLAALLLRSRARRRQRQLLLAELTQWLSKHEA